MTEHPRYMEADELIADVTTLCNRGHDEDAKQLLLRWADKIAAAGLVPPPWEDKKVCATCQGRGWVMKSLARVLGNGMGAGGAWNEPCPDCALPSSPLRSPKET